MIKEDYEELLECLIFMQLSLYDRKETLSHEGFITFAGMKFDGWDEKKTDEIIKKFIEKYGSDDNDN